MFQFIIPMKCLSSIDISNEYFSSIIDQNISSYFVQKSSNLKIIEWNLYDPLKFKYFEKLTELFPFITSYNLYEFSDESIKNITDSVYNLDDIIEINHMFFNFHISRIILWYQLPKKDYELIWSILELPNTRNYLNYLDLKLSSLSEALHILSLASKWSNLSNVILKYSLSEDDLTPEKSIREAKKKFMQKVGIIMELEISEIKNIEEM